MKEIRKCKEHDVYVEFEGLMIKTSDGKNYYHQFWICEKCHPKKQRTEEFYKKIALEHVKIWDSSYELSDILEAKV